MYTGVKIFKECADEEFEKLSCLIENGKHKKMRGIPVYKIAKGDKLYYVAAEQKGDTLFVHGWVLICKEKLSWKSWSVDFSYVFPQSRGSGWGKLLYDTIINRENIILASGSSQSVSGRRMWKSMVKSDRYMIWAHDLKNMNRYADVTYDDDTGKIHSELKMYQSRQYDWLNTTDVRLIAIKKSNKKVKL